jgi:Transmembrane secretion effector
VAHWLKDRGFEAYAVRGGVAALEGDAAAPVAVATPAGAPATGRPLAALRFPTFRRYAVGVLLSLTGNWIEAAAFGYVVLLLGGSAATLGLIGFLNTIPNLVWGLPAGVLADRYDRRRLLLGYQGANMAVAVALAALWQTGALTVGLMGALAVVGGSLGTLSYPAFQGLLASTVPAAELESAVAINSLSLQVARFLGPAIAGVLLAQGGPTWVFAANAASFVAVLGAVALLPAGAGAVRRAATATAEAAGGVATALRYVFAQRSLASLIVLTALGGVFATPPVAFMIPALARIQLGGGPATLGVLTAAIGLGSVVGAVLLLRLARRANKGEPLVAGFLVTGLAIVGVGLSRSVGLSAVLAAIGGCGGVVFVGLATVVVQASASDEMRARVSAIWAAAFVGLLPFGALLTGALAAWLGPGRAVAVDGAVAAAGALVIVARRPEVTWVGCAALPAACLAATDPGAGVRVTALTGGDGGARLPAR